MSNSNTAKSWQTLLHEIIHNHLLHSDVSGSMVLRGEDPSGHLSHIPTASELGINPNTDYFIPSTSVRQENQSSSFIRFTDNYDVDSVSDSTWETIWDHLSNPAI